MATFLTLSLLDLAGFCFEIRAEGGSLELINSVIEARFPDTIVPVGDSEVWAPRLWPTAAPKLGKKEGQVVEVTIPVRNIGFKEARNALLVIDKVTGSAEVVGDKKVSLAAVGKTNLAVSESGSFSLKLKLAQDSKAAGVIFHLECADETGYHYTFGDGNRPILFITSRDGDWEVYRMNKDGSEQRNLTREPSWDDFGILSPDGSTILFDSQYGGGWGIHAMDPDGSNRRRVSPENFRGRYPSWAPSGKAFLFQVEEPRDARGIYKVRLSDGKATCILSERGFSAAYSPEGGRIVFQRNVMEQAPPDQGKAKIFVMNSDGTNIKQISVSEEGDDHFAAWSPCGTKVAIRRNILRNPDPTVKPMWHRPYQEIILINADGSGEENITRNQRAFDWDPFWSPSGSLITFSSTTTLDANMELFVMRADGSERQKLTHVPGPQKMVIPNAPHGDWYPMWFGK